MDRTANFYSQPSHDFRGGSFHVFTGSRRQRGGSIFGSLKKFFTPIAKMLGSSLVSHGVGLARDVAQDAMAGKNIKDALKKRGKAAAIDFGKEALQKNLLGQVTKMIGRGRRRRTRRLRRKLTRKRRVKRRSTSRKSRARTSRKAPSRKRKARSKSSHGRKAKRRRVANF